MENQVRRFRVGPTGGMLASLLLAHGLVFGQMAHTPASSSNFHSKNLTYAIDQLALNPRFIENGREVLFLIFSGDPNSPKPWDYKLSRSDCDGQEAYFMTAGGVLDYNVLADEHGVLVLMALPSLQAEESHNDLYEEIRDWELWYLDLSSEEHSLLESARGLPLAEGYKILGLADLPNSTTGQITTASPRKTQRVLIKRQAVGFQDYFSYHLLGDPDPEVEALRTEAWHSYHDSEWWPDVVWLDESNLITLRFQSLLNEAFPQNEGLFSIVKIDLFSKSVTELHSDFLIKPFPRLALNPEASALFFQKFGKEDDITELWKLSLTDDAAEIVYSTHGDLGEARFASHGKSLVFTEVTDNHFDIIRLDLDRGRISNVVGR